MTNRESPSQMMESPLPTLANFFREQRDTDGTLTYGIFKVVFIASADPRALRIGREVKTSVTEYRKSKVLFQVEQVTALVTAIDVEGNQTCQRLDEKGAVIFCSILIASEACLAQQRGLCILTVG